ncbi:hypothetical protein DICVIV_10451 [Dictyocaulus viviparus]|uniref:Uncharacterized protein n=1 Tax=Dictyocaulus viviparus TaxID=29172 RepID=A0A0D8XFT2_DICVI|nr:hypothetical protein DICVIV_10451 [Dictyocaulus viviparus]
MRPTRIQNLVRRLQRPSSNENVYLSSSLILGMKYLNPQRDDTAERWRSHGVILLR